MDRIFFDHDNGPVPLTQFWDEQGPSVLRPLFGLLWLLEHRRLRPALRVALAEADHGV